MLYDLSQFPDAPADAAIVVSRTGTGVTIESCATASDDPKGYGTALSALRILLDAILAAYRLWSYSILSLMTMGFILVLLITIFRGAWPGKAPQAGGFGAKNFVLFFFLFVFIALLFFLARRARATLKSLRPGGVPLAPPNKWALRLAPDRWTVHRRWDGRQFRAKVTPREIERLTFSPTGELIAEVFDNSIVLTNPMAPADLAWLKSELSQALHLRI